MFAIHRSIKPLSTTAFQRSLKGRHVGEVVFLIAVFLVTVELSVARQHNQTISQRSHRLDSVNQDINLDSKVLDVIKHKTRHGHGSLRKRFNARKDSHHIGKHMVLGRRRQSCPSYSGFRVITRAEDIYGNTVDIAPQITVGGARVTQYFYQTVCANENCACIGIDETEYTSSCETITTLAYASILINGKETQQMIKVPTSCTCVTRRKPHRYRIKNIMDYID